MAYELPDVELAASSGDYFTGALQAIATPLDQRTDEELQNDGFSHPDPVMREQALFELRYRNEPESYNLLLKAFKEELERWNENAQSSLLAPENSIVLSLFEELSRLDRSSFTDQLSSVQLPSRIDRWHKVLGLSSDISARPLVEDPAEVFDQVIPLRISLRCYVRISDRQWKYWMASPLIVERTAGRLHACSLVDTRMERIVVSKQLAGLHADGSLHLENALFRGRTAMISDERSAFSFEARTKAPFWTSGRLGDRSKELIPNTVIDVVRSGSWQLDPALRIREQPIISDVRGVIQAWSYIDPARMQFDERGTPMAKPGEFIISSVADPMATNYVNTWIVGSYRGVTADYIGDGTIQLVPTPSYATLDGEIDRDRDGQPDEPGLHYDICEAILD